MPPKKTPAAQHTFTHEEICNQYNSGCLGAQPEKLMMAAGITEGDLLDNSENGKKLRQIIGHLFLKKRISGCSPSGGEASAYSVTAISDAVAAKLKAANTELVKSLEFTQATVDKNQKAFDNLQSEVAAITKQLKQSQQQQQLPAPSQSITISGLVEEGTEGRDLVSQVAEFLTEQVNPSCDMHVEGVERLGRLQEGKEGHRRLKVVLGSAAEAAAVLRAARNLRGFNITRKEAGKRPVGVDQFLSREEQEQKQALWGKWSEARKRQAPKTFWRGCRLFVEGSEVHP